MTEIGDFQKTIGEWQKKAFPDLAWTGSINHLRREVRELTLAMFDYDLDGIKEETADCMFILFWFANKFGFSIEDEINRKFEVLKNRKWGKPDSEGVIEHIRTEGEK